MHVRAQADHHVLQHMIGLNVERIGGDFGGRVPVADMPSDARQRLATGRVDLEQIFHRRHDFDEPAPLDLERVAVGEVGRLRQIEQERVALVGRHRHAPAIARLAIQGHRIDADATGHIGLPDDAGCAQHGRNTAHILSTLAGVMISTTRLAT